MTRIKVLLLYRLLFKWENINFDWFGEVKITLKYDFGKEIWKILHTTGSSHFLSPNGNFPISLSGFYSIAL